MTINVTRFLPAVIIALCLQGIAGGAVPPGICALSFGVVGSAEFPARASRNEMWKHVGAVVTAGLLPIIMVDVSAGGWTAYFAVMVRFCCVFFCWKFFLAFEHSHLLRGKFLSLFMRSAGLPCASRYGHKSCHVFGTRLGDIL